jgi:acyl-coenzyme A thioesterase PaaI-like protein
MPPSSSHPFFLNDQQVDLQVFKEHWRSLETMYSLAPVNVNAYKHSVSIPTFGEANVTATIQPELFHGGNAMHGSTFFKLLDDSAWFASQSLFLDYFIVTASFNTYIMKSISQYHIDKNLSLIAKGRVITATKHLIVAESELFCGNEIVAKGSGTFMFSPHKLENLDRYTAHRNTTTIGMLQSKL